MHHIQKNLFICGTISHGSKDSHLKRDGAALDAWVLALHPCLRSQFGWQRPFLHRLFIFACIKGTWAPLNMAHLRNFFPSGKKRKGRKHLQSLLSYSWQPIVQSPDLAIASVSLGEIKDSTGTAIFIVAFWIMFIFFALLVVLIFYVFPFHIHCGSASWNGKKEY